MLFGYIFSAIIYDSEKSVFAIVKYGCLKRKTCFHLEF